MSESGRSVYRQILKARRGQKTLFDIDGKIEAFKTVVEESLASTMYIVDFLSRDESDILF